MNNTSINVLVVDDDKLSRKGIISSMPWENYGMKVVGEAANGKQALDFLEKNQVDLVLTDLMMPVMSGLELIEQGKRIGVRASFIILTVHDDFEHVRSALRLGAIDYFSKVEFDIDNLHNILMRIQKSLSEERKQPAPVCKRDYIYAIVTNLNNKLIQGDIISVNVFEDADYIEHIGDSIVLVDINQNDYRYVVNPSVGAKGYICLKIYLVKGTPYKEIVDAMLYYQKNDFFYEFDPGSFYIEKELKELFYSKVLNESDFEKLKSNWVSLEWIHQEDLFNKFKFDLKGSQLTAAKLLHMLLAVENAWNEFYGRIGEETISVPANFHSWKDVESWLFTVYEKAQSLTGNQHFSSEILVGIASAQRYIQENYADKLLSEDVAAYVNMSRSYFSRCFKDIVGASFSEYLRNVRIEQAKKLLCYTNKATDYIAQAVGYDDSKYFSQVFRSQTGLLPSAFRKQYSSTSHFE